MTDRELLEAAAKAAGLADGSWFDGWNDEGRETGDYWNPLTLSGDAFELAVKLRLDLTFGATALLNTEYVYVGDSDTRTELHLDDLAATRRAIVRAAAAIGKEMK